MKREVVILDEPSLEFRYRQELPDPRDGLSLFGPCDMDEPSHPKSVSHGVIGPPEGITAFAAWSAAMNQAWLPPEKKQSPFAKSPPTDTEADGGQAKERLERLWPVYPGFEAAFCSTWHAKPAWRRKLDREPSTVEDRHPARRSRSRTRRA